MTTGHNRLPDIAADIRTKHKAARAAAELATENAIECGKLLIEAKNSVPHGDWLTWLREHCDLSERTAQAYMRLARKHGDMDEGKAQRVAGLPVREALKAVADEKAAPILPAEGSSWDEIWQWAESQVNAPFNRFDLESIEQSGDALLFNKLCGQTGVPAGVAMFLPLHTKELPALRLVSVSDIMDSITCLKDIAEGDCSGLDIDNSGLGDKTVGMMHTLALVAMRSCGLLFREIEARDYGAPDPASYADAYEQDRRQIHGAVLASLNDRLDSLRQES